MTRWFSDPQPGERLGYFVWGSGAVAVVVPEIWAAATNKSAWPTISSTVGHLEYEHDWVGLIVVALIALVGFYVLRHPLTSDQPAGDESRPPAPERVGRTLRRTPLGRLTYSPQTSRLSSQTSEPGHGVASVLLVVVGMVGVSLGAFLTAIQHPADAFILAYVLYGLIATFFIVVPSMFVFVSGRDISFPTLFKTIGYLERRIHPLAVLLLIGLVILLVHLALYPWPAVFHQLRNPGPALP